MGWTSRRTVSIAVLAFAFGLLALVVDSTTTTAIASHAQGAGSPLSGAVAKLEAYRANPAAYDNLGILERAPTAEIRQSIIDGRIRHLNNEIRTFQDQISKLLGGAG